MRPWKKSKIDKYQNQSRIIHGMKISNKKEKRQLLKRRKRLFKTLLYLLWILNYPAPRDRTLRRRPHVFRRIFLNPQLFLCGFGFCPHVSSESGTRILAYSEISTLASGSKKLWICMLDLLDTCGCGRKPNPQRKSCRRGNL